MAIFTNIEKLENIKNEFKTIMVENNIPLDDYVPFKNYPSMIRNNIGLLKDVKSALKTAIENKGVNVPDEASINSYADYIEQIETNPEIDMSEWISYFEDDEPETTIIPAGVTRTRKFLCWKQDSLIKKLYGSTVKEIAWCGFENCSALTSIDFPEVTTIGNYAFRTCSNLRTIKLPKLETVGELAFENTHLEDAITSLPNLRSVDNQGFQSSSIKLNMSDLSNLENLGDKAFYHYYRSPRAMMYGEKLEFQNNITIGESAFGYVTGDDFTLKFLNGGTLKRLAFESTNVTQVDLTGVEVTGEGIFSNCSKLTTVLNPPEEIRYALFNNCSKLINIDLSNCTYLTGFNSTGIGSQTFNKNITIQGGFNKCHNIIELIFKGKAVIEQGSFQGCQGLNKVVFEDTLTTKINGTSSSVGIFSGCSNLQSVTFNAESSLNAANSFANCTSLKTIDLANVTNLGSATFQGCSNLNEVKNYSLTHVPENCFASCSALKTIDLPNVTQISQYAFYVTGIEFLSFNQQITFGTNMYRRLPDTWFYNSPIKYIGFKQGFQPTSGYDSYSAASPFKTLKQLRKIYIHSSSTWATSKIFAGLSENLEIWTNAENEEALPASWITNQWTYINETHNAQVVYGASYEDFLVAVKADELIDREEE